MIKHIQKEIDKINSMIDTAKSVSNSVEKYKNCDIKQKIKSQSVGMVVGLEIAKESLEGLLKEAKPDPQMSMFSPVAVSIPAAHMMDAKDHFDNLRYALNQQGRKEKSE